MLSADGRAPHAWQLLEGAATRQSITVAQLCGASATAEQGLENGVSISASQQSSAGYTSEGNNVLNSAVEVPGMLCAAGLRGSANVMCPILRDLSKPSHPLKMHSLPRPSAARPSYTEFSVVQAAILHCRQARSGMQTQAQPHGAAIFPEDTMLDPEPLRLEVLALRQALADLSTLDGWTAAGELSDGADDLSVHRRHEKGADTLSAFMHSLPAS